jgi:signal transduction histidine kinase
VVYGSLTAAIAGGYFLILAAFAFLLQDMEGHNVLATIVFALIVVFGFQPLRDKIQQVTDRLFFKDKYDYRKTLQEFSGGLSSIIELERLSTLIVDTVTRTMHIDKSSLLLRDERWKGFKVSLAKGLEEKKVRNINFGSDNQLIRTLSNNGKKILNREEIEIRLNEDNRLRENEEKRKEFEAIKREMDQLEAMLSIPLMTKNRLIGIFNLGAKKSEGAFTGEDIGLLSTIANQAATAIENARLYSERREMEKALHQRDKMAALGVLASSIAHEIKNPLTPIKTFIQLLPRKFDDANFRNKFNSVVPQEIERLDNVLQELTNFSRPSEGKWHPVDVRKAVDEILVLMNGELSKHGIRIIKKYEDVPEITADGEHLKQVFMNLILNAIHAMSSGGTLTITTRLSRAETRAEKNLEISFTDTGGGIPPEDIPRLFNAFFTTKEKGTGLGLAISQKIIKDYGGSIDVKSELEKSTTFTINLPLGETESILSSNP